MKNVKHTIASLPYLLEKPQKSFFEKSLQGSCGLKKAFTIFHTLLAFFQKCYAQETIVIKRLTRGLQSQQKKFSLRRKFFNRVCKLCLHGINFG